jgi:segregation and condensation protein B
MNNHPFNIKRPADFFAVKCSKSGTTLKFLQTQSDQQTNDDFSDDSDSATVPFSEDLRSEAMANLEAVLFVSREPLSGRRLAQLADLSEGTRIRTLLRDLNVRYDHRQSAFHIVEVAGGFQLRTRPEFAPWLVRIQEVPVTVRLSSPAMETLAVIAYRQPVHRAEIEKLRGVQCGELIRQLLDRDLVKIVGRSEELGRPFYYGTTKNFLQIFCLGSLDDLPDRELFEIKEKTTIKSEQ